MFDINIDIKYIKRLGIYSLILGGACGLLSVFPFLMPFMSLFFVPFFGAIAPLVYLIKKDSFTAEDNKTFAILGAYSGACLCGAYFAVFMPLVELIHLINKNYNDYMIHYLNLFLFVLFFVMIAVIYICGNAVCGLLFGVVYNYIKGNKNEG